jgi:hypothetical protein
MLVLQFLRDALGLFVLDLFGRGAESFVGFVALFRAAHVGGGVGEGNPRFGQANEFDGLLRGDGERERLGVGQAASSLAKMTMRRAMKRKSSPAWSIFASQ